MAITYTTTKKVHELLQSYRKIPDTPTTTTNEAVGTGDGSTTVFWLDNGNVIAGTYTVYVNAVALEEGAGAGKFTIDKDEGKLTFGTAPTIAHAVTAKYWCSTISDSVVERAVYMAEDEMDSRMNHAFRTRYSGTQSGADVTARYEYHDIIHRYDSDLGGRPVFLGKRRITTLSAAGGDVLEVWDGSSWTNYIATKTESRSGDFWLDYDAGILYISRYDSIAKGVRIKYRYGEGTVPYDVEECATKISMMNLLRSGYFALTPQGNDYLAMREKIVQLREETDRLIARRAEYIII